MKKRLIIMLIAVFAVMAGCGQTNDEVKTTTADAKTNTVSENDTIKNLEIRTEKNAGGLNVTDKKIHSSEIIKSSQILSNSSEQKATAQKTQTKLVTDETSGYFEVTEMSDLDEDFNIFGNLSSLHYETITCDGLPEYELEATDGSVYLINLTDKWVRNNEKGDVEAVLSDELISWLNENGKSVGLKISEFAPIDDESVCEISYPSYLESELDKVPDTTNIKISENEAVAIAFEEAAKYRNEYEFILSETSVPKYRIELKNLDGKSYYSVFFDNLLMTDGECTTCICIDVDMTTGNVIEVNQGK